MLYLYIKSFHLIFVIAWMVSLLYLPRLFVYHSDLSKTSSTYKLFLTITTKKTTNTYIYIVKVIVKKKSKMILLTVVLFKYNIKYSNV